MAGLQPTGWLHEWWAGGGGKGSKWTAGPSRQTFNSPPTFCPFPAPLAQLLAAQQYNSSLRGYKPLLGWAERHTAAMHAPPAAAGHQVLITNGGNHTLEVC